MRRGNDEHTFYVRIRSFLVSYEIREQRLIIIVLSVKD